MPWTPAISDAECAKKEIDMILSRIAPDDRPDVLESVQKTDLTKRANSSFGHLNVVRIGCVVRECMRIKSLDDTSPELKIALGQMMSAASRVLQVVGQEGLDEIRGKT